MRFMGKITRFLESNTWGIIQCALFLALFIYLTITQIVLLPGVKHIVLILISVLGIILQIKELVMILKSRSKDR